MGGGGVGEGDQGKTLAFSRLILFLNKPLTSTTKDSARPARSAVVGQESLEEQG